MKRVTAMKSQHNANEAEARDIDLHLGERLSLLRKAARISQSELAEVLSLHQAAVSRIEKGIQSLTPTHLFLISKFFGVSVDGFIYGHLDYEAVVKRFLLGKSK